MHLGIIGAGNMAGAILSGILAKGLIPAEDISLSNPTPQKLAPYADRGIFTTCDNTLVVRRSDVLILAVKPQVFPAVLSEIAPGVGGKCAVSIAPGFSVAWLREMLPGCSVIRAMPNTPLLLGMGVTALARAPDIPQALFSAVQALFASAGEVVVIPEERMNAAIAVSGSSPAYFFRMADAMVKAACAQGLSGADALRMAALTMEGSARMLLSSGHTAEELVRQVCSPGGTTLAALTAFDDGRFDELIGEAMERCARRAAELGR